jgi:hypothetical protein
MKQFKIALTVALITTLVTASANASEGRSISCRGQTTLLGYQSEGDGFRAKYLKEYNRDILGEPFAKVDQQKKTALFYDRNYLEVFHRKYVVTDPDTGYATYKVYEHIRGLDQLVDEGKCNYEPQNIVCENEGGTQAKLVFQGTSPGRAKASVMEYQGRSVLVDPYSVFNHMGVYPFRGAHGIEFIAYDSLDDFTVTVPAFGGKPVVTAKGKCRVEI